MAHCEDIDLVDGGVANDDESIRKQGLRGISNAVEDIYNPSVAKTYKLTCGCTSHTYGSAVITKQPTCTSEGTKTKTCTQCGATVTETIAKLSLLKKQRPIVI